MKTHAIDKGDHYEVHGNKMWISQAQVGDAGLLYAYTDRSKGNKGMTAFIIKPKKMKGCTALPIETKLGLHCSPTGEFVFEGMQVRRRTCSASRAMAFASACGSSTTHFGDPLLLELVLALLLDERRRDLLRREAPRGFLDHRLFFGQFELHRFLACLLATPLIDDEEKMAHFDLGARAHLNVLHRAVA